MVISQYDIAQEKAALFLECDLLSGHLTQIERLLMTKAEELKQRMKTLHEKEMELLKCRYTLEHGANPLRSPANNLQT